MSDESDEKLFSSDSSTLWARFMAARYVATRHVTNRRMRRNAVVEGGGVALINPTVMTQAETPERKATRAFSIELPDHLQALGEHVAVAVAERLRTEIDTSSNQGPEPDMLTVQQVADRLQVSERTIQTLIHSGEIPSVKIRRCRRIPAAAFDAYVRRKAEEGRCDG